jgi:(R)-2-hydroxyacyl-CoA dehydratese activating ATPase
MVSNVRVLGLDIGSRSVDAVWLEGGGIVSAAVADSGYDPASVAAAFVDRGEHDLIVATGYGRHLARETFGADVVTEIKAYAVGAHALFPRAGAVLDIGGQDTKAIALKAEGRVADFEMNDKCAAGTGKFLEIMATALGFTLQEMAESASAAPAGLQISSMCTVFAESEVTGLVHKGEDRGRIARGLHDAIVRRTLSSLKRVGAAGPLVFAGGVARNQAMVALIREGYGGEVLVPEQAQIVGAYGAALSGWRQG